MAQVTLYLSDELAKRLRREARSDAAWRRKKGSLIGRCEDSLIEVPDDSEPVSFD